MCASAHNPGDSLMLAVRSSPGWKVTVKQSFCTLRANLQVMLLLLRRTAAALLAGAFRQDSRVLSHFGRLHRHTAPSSCPETQLTALEMLCGTLALCHSSGLYRPKKNWFGYGSLLRGLSRYQSSCQMRTPPPSKGTVPVEQRLLGLTGISLSKAQHMQLLSKPPKTIEKRGTRYCRQPQHIAGCSSCCSAICADRDHFCTNGIHARTRSRTKADCVGLKRGFEVPRDRFAGAHRGGLDALITSSTRCGHCGAT